MAEGYRLVVLDCPSCGAPLAAEGEDVVYYCTACYSGYRLDPVAERLEPVEVAFVSLPGVAADRYLPFWLLPAKIEISQRQATGAAFSGLMGFLLGGDEETPAGEGTFAIPAAEMPLAATSALARRYTEALPRLGERLGERLTGGRYGVEDATKLAHYTLIASEAEKPDTLKDLDYALTFGPARLLGVPFVRRDDRLADAVFGLTF